MMKRWNGMKWGCVGMAWGNPSNETALAVGQSLLDPIFAAVELLI